MSAAFWTPEAWYEEAFRTARAGAAQTRSMAAYRLAALQKPLPHLSPPEIVEELQASNARRIHAVPDLKQFPELIGMRDLVQAQWRGVRDGAELDDAAWAASCDGSFYYERLQARPEILKDLGFTGTFPARP